MRLKDIQAPAVFCKITNEQYKNLIGDKKQFKIYVKKPTTTEHPIYDSTIHVYDVELVRYNWYTNELIAKILAYNGEPVPEGVLYKVYLAPKQYGKTWTLLDEALGICPKLVYKLVIDKQDAYQLKLTKVYYKKTRLLKYSNLKKIDNIYSKRKTLHTTDLDDIYAAEEWCKRHEYTLFYYYDGIRRSRDYILSMFME